MKRKEIVDKLVLMGINRDIRTLTKDIRVLNEFGFEVISYSHDHEKYYYVPEAQGFAEPEQKILIDAIQLANKSRPSYNLMFLSSDPYLINLAKIQR